MEGIQGDCEHELPARSTLPLGKSHWPQPSGAEGTEDKRAVCSAHGRVPDVTPAPGLAPLSDPGWDKAGQGSATPSQAGAAPIPAPLPGLQPCLFQVFKLFQSARTTETFGKQLLISRAESVSFYLREGQIECGDLVARAALLQVPRPSAGAHHHSLGPQPEALSCPGTSSFLRQTQRGWGIFGSAARAACLRRTGLGSCPALGGREAWRGWRPAGD